MIHEGPFQRIVSIPNGGLGDITIQGVGKEQLGGRVVITVTQVRPQAGIDTIAWFNPSTIKRALWNSLPLQAQTFVPFNSNVILAEIIIEDEILGVPNFPDTHVVPALPSWVVLDYRGDHIWVDINDFTVSFNGLLLEIIQVNFRSITVVMPSNYLDDDIGITETFVVTKNGWVIDLSTSVVPSILGASRFREITTFMDNTPLSSNFPTRAASYSSVGSGIFFSGQYFNTYKLELPYQPENNLPSTNSLGINFGFGISVFNGLYRIRIPRDSFYFGEGWDEWNLYIDNQNRGGLQKTSHPDVNSFGAWIIAGSSGEGAVSRFRHFNTYTHLPANLGFIPHAALDDGFNSDDTQVFFLVNQGHTVRNWEAGVANNSYQIHVEINSIRTKIYDYPISNLISRWALIRQAGLITTVGNPGGPVQLLKFGNNPEKKTTLFNDDGGLFIDTELSI